MEETDVDLLTEYRQGRTEALERLVRKYRSVLYGFIVNMTEGREDADEVFQEVWLRAIRKLRTYRHKNFGGWLIRIAHNLVIDRARRRKPDFSLDAELDDGRSMGEVIPSSERGPREEIVASDVSRQVALAVDALPAEQKEVFVMRVKTGLSFKEIAGIQNVSINTALARMQYALAKLRQALSADYGELA